MDLRDARVELGCVGGHIRGPDSPGGEHHVTCLVALVPGVDQVTAGHADHVLDAAAELDRQPEVLRVGLEVVRHLVLGRVVARRAGERHPRQPGEAGAREQPQRIPAVSPGIAHALAAVEDDEVAPEPG